MGSDKQLLLGSKLRDASESETEDDDLWSDVQFSVKSLFKWRRWFRKTKDFYTEHISNKETVGVLQIFRFADRTDLFLMFMTTCIAVLEMILFVAVLVLFGRLTGLFAMESFANDCHHQQKRLIDTMMNNLTCPPGIDIASLSTTDILKLCRYKGEVLSRTTSASLPSFRAQVMDKVYWLFLVGILQFCALTVGTCLWMITVRRQIARINILLVQSLLQRNITYFDTTPKGQINARLLSSIKTIEMGIGADFKLLILAFIYVIGSLITSLAINWQLTLIMLSATPFVFGAASLFTKTMTNEETNELIARSEVGQIVEEVFSSLRTVMSFNGAKYEQKRYEKELSRTRWNSVRKGAAFGIYVGWLFFVTYIIYALGFLSGSFLVSYNDQNRFNISDILVIVSLFALCARILANCGTYFQALSEARAAAVLIFRVIDQKHDPSINEGNIWKEGRRSDAESLSDINGDIEFDHVDFTYPVRKGISALRDLSIIARAGQTTALVGISGSGKSTCISLLLRQYEVTSGRIKIDGRSITDYDLKELRQNIGVVSQEPILFNMSIYENIRYGKIDATQTEIEDAARQANAHNFIMQLPDKYETLVGERGVQLSGGEKQRIALARALVKQPAIFLLDEATSALDHVSEKIVQDAIDQACKNRTTIVVAHRLTTIQNAHQIYVLENGHVVEEGTHKTLMTKQGGKYQSMVRRQQTERKASEVLDIEHDTEENQQTILTRQRKFSDKDIADSNKEDSVSFKRKSLFRTLLSMSSPDSLIILIGCVSCAFIGAAQTLFAILLAKIVGAFNYCTISDNSQEVFIFSCLFLLLGVILLILRFIQYTMFAFSGSKLAARIRVKTFACLLRQEMAFFDRPENSSGAISVRLSSDVAALEQMVGIRLGVICEALTVACFGFLFGIFFSWQLTIIVSVMFVIILLVSYLKMEYSRRLSQQSDIILRKANTFAIEFIHNMRIVKQLSAEKEILEQYSNLIHQASKMSQELDRLIYLMFAILWAVEPCFFALIYWCALILYEQNELTSKDIIMVFSFAMFATQALRVVGMLARRVGQSLSAAENFFDLFDRSPTIDNASSEGQDLVDFRGEITFDQVKFTYPSRPTSTVLNKLQLTIKPGQRVAIVGTSGCGKSTMIQLLERFYDVNKGQVLLDGIDIRQLNIQSVRSHLGLVSQEPVLFDLTIAENITYGLENVPMEDIINAAAKANIDQFICQLPHGYETRVGTKGCFLSGGEKQRIAIARVLLRRPKVLLLDEATSALDLYNEQIVQQTLKQAEIEDPTRTSLIIAHRLSTIRSCDMICVLDAGHIVESGTHTELMKERGIYYSMLAQNNI